MINKCEYVNAYCDKCYGKTSGFKQSYLDRVVKIKVQNKQGLCHIGPHRQLQKLTDFLISRKESHFMILNRVTTLSNLYF